jgi:transcriptional regulator with XRE-family HTH domain
VTTKERVFDRGTRTGHRLLNLAGSELREARLLAGLSQTSVAEAAGSSASVVSRIEHGQAAGASVMVLARIAVVVGLELHLRAYPAGEPVRDAAQRRLLERLRIQLASSLTWRTEVPLPIQHDQRAWDAVIRGSAPDENGRPRVFLLGVEAETRIRDVQALQRRLALKRRDGGVHQVILLVADTRSNRTVLQAAEGILFPDLTLPQPDALAALRQGRCPAGSSLIRL